MSIFGTDPHIIYGNLPVWPGNQPGNAMNVSFGGNQWSAPNVQAAQMVRYLKNMEPASGMAPATGGIAGALGPAITMLGGLLGQGGGGGGLFSNIFGSGDPTGGLGGGSIGSWSNSDPWMLGNFLA
jgi:hypothetical protein